MTGLSQTSERAAESVPSPQESGPPGPDRQDRVHGLAGFSTYPHRARKHTSPTRSCGLYSGPAMNATSDQSCTASRSMSSPRRGRRETTPATWTRLNWWVQRPHAFRADKLSKYRSNRIPTRSISPCNDASGHWQNWTTANGSRAHTSQMVPPGGPN